MTAIRPKGVTLNKTEGLNVSTHCLSYEKRVPVLNAAVDMSL